jgi:hypothetical protein
MLLTDALPKSLAALSQSIYGRQQLYNLQEGTLTHGAIRATVEVDAENAVLLDVREDGLSDLVVVGGHAKSWVRVMA